MYPNGNVFCFHKSDVTYLKRQLKHCKNPFERKQLEKDVRDAQRSRW